MKGLIIIDRFGTEPNDVEEIGHKHEQVEDAAVTTEDVSIAV